MNKFEIIILEIVNETGVDINSCIKFQHLQSPLQFICGFGPRKAFYLLNFLKNKGTIEKRKNLLDIPCLKKTIYQNCISFLKINDMLDLTKIDNEKDFKYQWLDFTRIHPDNYNIAIQLAQAATEQKLSKENEVIFKIFKDNKLLDEIDKEDYSNYLSQNKTNMIPIIDFIYSELKAPYFDQRMDFNQIQNSQEIFYQISKESPFHFQIYSIVTVKLIKITEKGFVVQTNNNLIGFINGQDIQDDNQDYDIDQILKQYNVNDFIRVRIKSIDYEKLKIQFLMKSQDMVNHLEYLKRNKIFESFQLKEENFSIIREEDYPIFSEGKVQIQNYIPRKINHLNYKNIGLNSALEYLEKKIFGNFIFRPSSKGINHLNLTWKLYDHNLVHILIKEGYKSQNDFISKELKINNQLYSSFEDIIENLIKPCNLHIVDIIKHQKFSENLIEQVKKELEEEKTQCSQRIPYRFSFCDEQPLFLILTYIPEKNCVKHEGIKINPEGLKFHGMVFPNLLQLIKYFKEQFKTKEYQKYLTFMPDIQIGKVQTSVSMKKETKKEENPLGIQLKHEPKKFFKNDFRKKKIKKEYKFWKKNKKHHKNYASSSKRNPHNFKQENTERIKVESFAHQNQNHQNFPTQHQSQLKFEQA